MGKRRHTTVQIIAKLREAEIELAKGQALGEVVSRLGIAEQTYYRWRKEDAKHVPARRDRRFRFDHVGPSPTCGSPLNSSWSKDLQRTWATPFDHAKYPN